MRSEGEKELPEDSALQEQIEKLNQIGIGLSSETNLEDLLELIVFEAREFTGADGGSLYILDEDETLYFNVSQNDTLSRRPDPPPGFKP